MIGFLTNCFVFGTLNHQTFTFYREISKVKCYLLCTVAWEKMQRYLGSFSCAYQHYSHGNLLRFNFRCSTGSCSHAIAIGTSLVEQVIEYAQAGSYGGSSRFVLGCLRSCWISSSAMASGLSCCGVVSEIDSLVPQTSALAPHFCLSFSQCVSCDRVLFG